MDGEKTVRSLVEVERQEMFLPTTWFSQSWPAAADRNISFSSGPSLTPSMPLLPMLTI
jgi:hypothetical protein